ncbi:hypothetical protein TNCV_3824421 [Trichonephila clavipes]|nr:hypothetical protein TNCV_3824421 [Trichonephila clavipes]
MIRFSVVLLSTFWLSQGLLEFNSFKVALAQFFNIANVVCEVKGRLINRLHESRPLANNRWADMERLKVYFTYSKRVSQNRLVGQSLLTGAYADIIWPHLHPSNIGNSLVSIAIATPVR